jgi:hypothetical protein
MQADSGEGKNSRRKGALWQERRELRNASQRQEDNGVCSIPNLICLPALSTEFRSFMRDIVSVIDLVHSVRNLFMTYN